MSAANRDTVGPHPATTHRLLRRHARESAAARPAEVLFAFRQQPHGTGCYAPAVTDERPFPHTWLQTNHVDTRAKWLIGVKKNALKRKLSTSLSPLAGVESKGRQLDPRERGCCNL
jgi:hypothetical protein